MDVGIKQKRDRTNILNKGNSRKVQSAIALVKYVSWKNCEGTELTEKPSAQYCQGEKTTFTQFQRVRSLSSKPVT